MPNPKYYIPILKWKPAEKEALKRLSSKEKKFIVPLLQIVMPQPTIKTITKSPEEQLKEVIAIFQGQMPKIPNEVIENWGKELAFIDLNLALSPDLRAESLRVIIPMGERLGLSLVPVVNLSSDVETKKMINLLTKKYHRGLCLRLVRADFISLGVLSDKVNKFLTESDLSEKDVDILIDLKFTDVDDTSEYLRIREIAQGLPSILKWRSLIFASGAFPVDLSGFEVGDNYTPRLDWNRWLEQVSSKEIIRRPSFADYTILHPIQKESARFFSPSASIRYTLDDKWLIMRGQKGKSVQYLANARLLSQDSSFVGIFKGEGFSFGDTYIAEKGKDLKSKKTGNSKNWLTVGINHHLVCTTNQLANLP